MGTQAGKFGAECAWKFRAENAGTIPRGIRVGDSAPFLAKPEKPFREIRRGKRVDNSAANGAEKSSSKEEEGVCERNTHTPPLVYPEDPHPNPGSLAFRLDFDGRDPPTTTAQMHRVTVRNGKPQFHDSPALAKARADLCARLERFAPDAPFEGPVALSVTWVFRTRGGQVSGWRTAKPDTDNLEKLLKDCMTRTRFWIDDAQVAFEAVSKLNGMPPGIFVTIRELD